MRNLKRAASKPGFLGCVDAEGRKWLIFSDGGIGEEGSQVEHQRGTLWGSRMEYERMFPALDGREYRKVKTPQQSQRARDRQRRARQAKRCMKLKGEALVGNEVEAEQAKDLEDIIYTPEDSELENEKGSGRTVEAERFIRQLIIDYRLEMLELQEELEWLERERKPGTERALLFARKCMAGLERGLQEMIYVY